MPTVDLPTESYGAPPPEPFDVELPRSRKVGPYSIQSVIASGGMGTVYIAVQEHPRRRVALKMMKRGIASKSALRRFEYESQILARLRHPNIAQVFEAGTHDDGEGGVPYFAMEYVPNARPITDYARTSKLGTRERLALLAKVCDAVHHGHQRGIIHRDLKPSNILVDSDGLPKIIDFGVARSTDSDMAVTTLQTHVGQVVGTLQYMSPEQCDADPDDLDIRTDVYALGVVLYELLTEQLPYDLSKVTMLDVARMIRETTPPRPSAINRTLRGDVETITLKALEKDRTRRYGSAGALAEDMRRYLRSEPIDARPPSVAYLFGRYASRHRPFVLGAAAVLLVLVAGLVVTSLLLVRAIEAEALARDRLLAVEQAESQASRRAEELEQVAAFQDSQLSGIDVKDMAEWLHEDLVASVRAGLERRGRAPSEIDADLAQLTDLLAEASLAGVSLRTLDRNIFDRAHIALNEQFAAQPLVKARLLQALARTQIELGLLAQTTEVQEEAVEIRRRELGDEHADTLSSINNMGYLLAAQGKWSAAEPYYREALEARRRLLGNEHPDTLVSINNMGYLLVARGESSAAEPYYREALETRRRVLGDQHPDTLVSISSMGGLLEAQGKLSEAELYYFEALETSRRVLGDEHLDTLVAINNAGALLQAQGKLDAAEALYRKALETRRRILGDEHADTLASINNIGYLLQAQGKLPDAERYFREALGTRRRVLGDEHPDTLLSLNNLGALLQAQGKLSEAEEYYHEALETRRRVLGDQHTDTLTSINNMGFLLAAQGKLSEAEPYYREAAQTARATLPEGHWFLGAFAFNHGRTLGDLHRFDEAESVLLEAHDILDAALGPDHDRTHRSVSAIVDLYKAWHEAAPEQGYDTKAAEWQAKQQGA